MNEEEGEEGEKKYEDEVEGKDSIYRRKNTIILTPNKKRKERGKTFFDK